MFEVQCDVASNDWDRTGHHAGIAAAELLAAREATRWNMRHRIIDHTTGRVVAVFGSSGKRLTFPIATAIAYTALAQAISAAKAGKP